MRQPSAKTPAQEKDFWKSVEKMARQVDSWPQWMKGGEGRKVEAAPETPRSPLRGGKELSTRHSG